jgi:hypothetical protein
MKAMRTPFNLVMASLAIFAASCTSGWEKATMMPAVQGCAAGNGDDCWHEGEYWLHKSIYTYYSYYVRWSLPVDRDRARTAYTRGCELNSLRSCIALVERHLVDTPADVALRAKLMEKISGLGGFTRSDEEVQAADDATKKLCVADEQQTQSQTTGVGESLAIALQQVQVTQQHAYLATAPQNPSLAPGQQAMADMHRNVNETVADYEARMAQKRAAAGSAKGNNSTAATQKFATKTQQQQQQSEQQRQTEQRREAQDKAKADAERQRKDALATCLAKPITRMRHERTNPFGAYAQAYRTNRDRLANSCAPPRPLRECFTLADKAAWPDERAKKDIDEFHRSDEIDCHEVPFATSIGRLFQVCPQERDQCMRSLDSAIEQLECANTKLPEVWASIDAKSDDEARTRRDAECHRQYGD